MRERERESPEREQEQTLFKDLRHYYDIKNPKEETYLEIKSDISIMTDNLSRLDPTLKRINRVEVSRRILADCYL